MPPSQIKAILFDMDGTLANSLPKLFDFYCNFMSKFQLQGTPTEFKELMNLSLTEVVALLKERYHLEISKEELYQLYIESLDHYYEHVIQPYDDVHPFIEYATQQEFKLALVTSASAHLAEKFLISQELRSQFHAIITSKNGRRDKPAPDNYLEALQVFNISAQEAIAIEDSTSGLTAAITAGIPTIWLCHNLNEIPQQIQQQLYAIAHNWKECLNCLKGAENE